MNKIPNRQAICEVLMDKAKDDKDIMVLCSDSRGSASMTPFADNFPDQFIETGIAEQNLVSISAGLAKCGKKPFACSPALSLIHIYIALIGTSSVEWIESYLGIITGCATAVPLDAALPCEELIDLINRCLLYTSGVIKK